MALPRRIEVVVRGRGDDTLGTISFGAGWILAPIVLVVAIAVTGGLVLATYRDVRTRAEEYASLASEVEALRRNNRKLQILEQELVELRELQQQMLRLAGIEPALGVDLELLEELRSQAPADSFPEEPGLLLWPVDGPVLSGFTRRHPGVDLAAPMGRTVVAAGHGQVEETSTDRAYGRTVRLDHGDGLETVYANLSLNLVEVGDSVRTGQVIGLVGVGREGGEPHLHFEVLREGRPVPPEEEVRKKTQSGP